MLLESSRSRPAESSRAGVNQALMFYSRERNSCCEPVRCWAGLFLKPERPVHLRCPSGDTEASSELDNGSWTLSSRPSQTLDAIFTPFSRVTASHPALAPGGRTPAPTGNKTFWILPPPLASDPADTATPNVSV